MSSKVVVAEGLVKRFGDLVAVNHLSFSLDAGDIYCLVGPNGAGKTTTLRMVVGLLKPDSGRVLIEGFDIQADRVEALRRVGYVPDYPNLPSFLTPLEFMYYVAALRGFRRAEVEDYVKYYVDVFNMVDEIKKPIRTLSRGGLQKTAIVSSLIARPRVVVMDEPLTNIEIDTQVMFKRVVRKLATEEEVSFLISSHMLSLIEGVCSEVGIIDKGRLIAEGSMESILRLVGERARFEEVYMKVLGRDVEGGSGSN
ncbi:MAG: ABC transporter ATP-binding protein [Zestosphaera sp.]